MRLTLLALALTTLLSPVSAQPGSYAVGTVAGDSGWMGYEDGLPTAAARFSQPTGVAVGPLGGVIVSEPAARTLRRISPTGIVSTFSGHYGATGSNDGNAELARFRQPAGLTSDSSSNVYVADLGADRITIRQVSSDGAVLTLSYTRPNDGTPLPTSADGLAAGPGGVFALTETSNNRLLFIKADGSVVVYGAATAGDADGAAADARFNGPKGVGFDTAGVLYVADTGNNTIRKIAIDGTVSTLTGHAGVSGAHDGTTAEALFDHPSSVIAASDGTLYVADTGNHLLRKIATDNTVSSLAGYPGMPGETDGTSVPTAATFQLAYALLDAPTGLAFDLDGNLVVTEPQAGTVRRVTPAGIISTVGGFPYDTAYTDGKAVSARFNTVDGAAVDADGNIFCVDFGDHTIRKVTPLGLVSTFAGKAYTPGSTDATGTNARFRQPRAIVHAPSGDFYIADRGNHVIRKMTAAGVVSTYSGQAGSSGSANGGRLDARFNAPSGLAFDSAGNLYVSDTGNHVIRKIATDGTVSTFAGVVGTAGGTNGPAGSATFNRPAGLNFDSSGALYVCQPLNFVVRKIATDGTVSTFAGTYGSSGGSETDGPVAGALFDFPSDIVFDANGNALVADYFNDAIRKVSADGLVSTVAGTGTKGNAGHANGKGVAVKMNKPIALTFGPSGALIISDSINGSVRRGIEIPKPPSVRSHPGSQTRASGSNVTLSVTAANGDLSYQWFKNGVAIDGATASTLSLTSVKAADAGDYTVVVTNLDSSVSSRLARLTVAEPTTSRISNMSVRSTAGVGGAPLIVGFSMLDGTRSLLLRGAGPSLSQFEVTGYLADPELFLHQSVNGNDSIVAHNNNWGDDGLAATLQEAFSSVGAFGFTGTSSLDAALIVDVSGSRTLHINSHVSGENGVVIAEAYDLGNADTPRLINISARNHAGSGSATLIAGFVLHGNTPKKILIRGIGPTLSAFGVQGVLANPRLELHTQIAGNDTIIATNDNWVDEPEAQDGFTHAGAFYLPSDSKDAAIVMTLPEGAYTAHVTGADGGEGEALVEVYEVR